MGNIYPPHSSEGINNDPNKQKRWEMVENQIISRGIKNAKVIEAMLKVKRHLFVPEKYADLAYYDRPIPIEHGQTVSQPYMVALMTETLRPEKRFWKLGRAQGIRPRCLPRSGVEYSQ
jgi:protein-L-isoaspartate(D-aspartate) O-methyltransferase